MAELNMLNKTNRFFFYLILFSALLAGGNCKKDSGAPKPTPVVTGEDPLKPAAEISTSVAGTIVDESGKPVAGVRVMVQNKEVLSTDAGSFFIDQVSVPGNRCVIRCKKEGFFEGTRAEIPVKDNITKTKIVLMSSAATQSISAGAGGKVTLNNGSEVQIPANGVVDANGNPYSGMVNIALRYLDPTSPAFGRVVPGGDMLAKRTDQSTTMLYSYGILRVKLTGTGGQDLQIANGKTSTLVMDIPDKQVSKAPASIPLWYFDDEKGIWQEEGSATKQGDKYIGTVKHFTDWNCDDTAGTATIKGKLIDCKNMPGWGFIELGQATVETDPATGEFIRRVPAGEVIPVTVYNPLILAPLVPTNDGKGKLIVVVPPLSPGQVYDVGTVQIYPCPVTVSANFKLNNGDRITSLLFFTESGSMEFYDQKDHFTMGVFPDHSKIKMMVNTNSGIWHSQEFTTGEPGSQLDLGTIDITKGDIIDSHNAFITGKLVCKNDPLPDGQVSAVWGSPSAEYEYAVSGTDGIFKIKVATGQSIELTMQTNKGIVKRTVQSPAATDATVDVGTIDFCSGPQPGENSFVIDGDGYVNALKVLSPAPYPQSLAFYQKADSTTGVSIADVSDTLNFVVVFTGNSTGSFKNVKTGLSIQRKIGGQVFSYIGGFDVDGTEVEVTVTRYDPVGGLVEGTFKGTCIGYNGNKVTISNGKFSVTRWQDL